MDVLAVGIIFVIGWAILAWRYWHDESMSRTKDILYNVALFVALVIGGSYIVYWLLCNTTLAFMIFIR